MNRQTNRFCLRFYADGTHDLICLKCFRTVASEESEIDLEEAERNHICDPDILRHYLGLD